MSYSSLLQYVRDVANSLDGNIEFTHGRKEVLHELNDAPELDDGRNDPENESGIVVWSLPFTATAGFTDTAQQFNKTYTVNIIFYKKDYLGSEMDQDDRYRTQDEIQILEQTSDLADAFVRKFNFNDISIDVAELSELLEITSVTFDTVIKDNDYLLTGTLLSLDVLVPDEFDYCSLETPEEGIITI